MYISLNFAFVFLIVHLVKTEDEPTVKTLCGIIKGRYKISPKGSRYAAFEGIPYALPPIGHRRFEPPTPIKSWKGVLLADKVKENCIGCKFVPIDKRDDCSGVEDCLYLNVYVPEKKSSEALPVIFYIYGGGFMFSPQKGGEENYLIDHNVIFVSFSHRHGVLGFMSTEDDLVPGNMGLKDQVVAIRWVFDNIRYFGGDPKKITLLGCSSGGASIHYHYLSPMSRGLFHAGISLSGNALSPRAQARDVKSTTIKLGKILKCPVKNISQLVECLKNLPVDTLVRAQAALAPWKLPNAFFGPMIEKNSKNSFISRSPIDIITSRDAYDVPWITGNARDEGLFPVAEFGLNVTAMKMVNDNWSSIAPVMLTYEKSLPKNEHYDVALKIRKHYFGENPIDRKNLKSLVDMVGDRLFKVSAAKAAMAMAKANRGPVWFYEYSYEATGSSTNNWTKSNIKLGVCHCDDMNLALNGGFSYANSTARDLEMQEALIRSWTSVARTGVPGFVQNWQRLNSSDSDLRYLEILDPKNYEMKSRSDYAQTDFWSTINFDENIAKDLFKSTIKLKKCTIFLKKSRED